MLVISSLFGSDDNICIFQYVPLPLFFAEDKLSFYKVMSDTQGYKHIHYVKDVSGRKESAPDRSRPAAFAAC